MRLFVISVQIADADVRVLELTEGSYVVGSGTAADVVLPVEGIAERHLAIWLMEGGIQLEDLAGGVTVNGHAITARVEAECPVSVGLPGVTLLVEPLCVLEADPGVDKSADVTIPAVRNSLPGVPVDVYVTLPVARPPTVADPDITIPVGIRGLVAQRAPHAVQKGAGDKAPLTGEYTLIKEIARGGMGQIYFGEDPQLRRQVAVKVSSLAQGGLDPRFTKEAEVLAQLAHPNVVPIHAIGVDEQGRPYYSMKLVHGRTLQAVLNDLRGGEGSTRQEYPRATLLTIFRKVCDAVMFAHAKGILHRDLKPENIMVGEYGEVLVMDWGLAKVLGEKEANGTSRSAVADTGNYGMTMEGDVMGTPQYMSPEQAEGMVAELDERSDIYALGGILFAILTLRPPVEGRTLDEVLTKVKRGEISSMMTRRGEGDRVDKGTLAAIGGEVPEALRAVTLKAMRTDRNERYASVEALAADIEAYQNGFATSAEDAGALRQLVLFIKRNKGVSAAVALFLAAAVAFTLKLAASERIARANEKLALAEREKSRRSAAIAQISVAEAAESVSDSVALQRALAEVPEDLRTPDWEYFQGRIDTPTFSIIAPKGRSWVGLEDWPSDPERMVVLRSDGEVFAVNVTTGVLQPLWKSSPPGAKEHGPLGVSLDGKLAAIGYKLKSASNTFQVDICNLGDGARVAQISGPSYLRRILMNGSICILIGESKVEAWDHPSARLLWEEPGFFHADFSVDQKSVLLAGDHSRGVERRDALSGKVLSEGVKGAPDLQPNFPHNGIGSPGWNRFYSPEFGRTRLRAVVPWTGKVQFEVAPTYGNYACTLIPPGDFIAVLGRTSAEGAVLEIRGASSGMLSRSLPVLEPLPNQRSSASLRAKEGAVVLRSARALRIWRLASAGSGLWMDFSSFLAGVRCGDTSQLVTGIRRDDVVAMQLCDGAEKDRVKRVRQEMGEWKAKKDIPGFYISPDGARLIVGISGMYGAYRVGSSGLEEIWPPKQIAGLPASSSSPTGAPFVIHPVEDRVWTGSAVYEFSTGRKLVAVTDREGLNVSYAPVWVGVNRVAEIAVKDDQREVESGGASGEKVQIALWDAEAGRLVAKTTAPDANWLGVSPDGLHLAEAGADKCVRIRSSRTLEVEREFRAHEDSVTGIAWHPTLPLLVTASKDGCIRIWNRESFRRVEELIADPTVYAIRAEISPNGLELNELRRNGIRVHKPQSFQGPKPGAQ